MPFVNKQQAKACFAKHDPRWDCAKWEDETPGGIKSLPKNGGGGMKKPEMGRHALLSKMKG